MVGRLGIQSALVAFGLGVAAYDFNGFATRAADMRPDAVVTGDGVVALTGGSGLRIGAAVDLVAAGRGKRLLISGVHEDVTLPDLQGIAGGAAEVYACCVDIGYEADSTLGNADETADWAQLNQYKKIIVVTSDYHIARSMIVLKEAMPNAELVSYPVRTTIDPSKIWSNPKSFRGVLKEWIKWRVTTVIGPTKR